MAKLYLDGIEIPHSCFDGYLFSGQIIEIILPLGYSFNGWFKIENGEILTSNSFFEVDESDLNLVAKITQLDISSLMPVVINEVSSQNETFVNDHFKKKNWIELYNMTENDIDLSAFLLHTNGLSYNIKGGENISSVIKANGYKVIWCDNQEPVSDLHVPLKLDANGGELTLTCQDCVLTDTFKYPALSTNQTAGRYPDGSDKSFIFSISTINKANVKTSYMSVVDEENITGIRDYSSSHEERIKINYRDGFISIGATNEPLKQVSIINLQGQMVENLTLFSNKAVIDCLDYSPGVYIVIVKTMNGHRETQKLMFR